MKEQSESRVVFRSNPKDMEAITLCITENRLKGRGKLTNAMHIICAYYLDSQQNPPQSSEIDMSKQNDEHLNLKNKEKPLDFPTDCYDMRPVSGKHHLRRCIAPSSGTDKRRFVELPRINGTFISDDPRICWRCKALREQKEDEKEKKRHGNHKNLPEKAFCKRDEELFNEGEKDCINCSWTSSECKYKRQALMR